MAGKPGASGGKRAGSGRPRTWLEISIPSVVMRQIEEIARVEQTTVLDVVKTALLEFITNWQDQHDSGE